MKNKFYITTTLPYVNSDPHLGFALEMVQADAIARYHKLLGEEVFFNTGTDEHGVKVYRKAKEEGKEIQNYVDEYAEKFKQLMPSLGILPDIHFIRTTESRHIKAAQEFWNRCFDAGDIYKKIYNVKYCVGCELEKTESDLDENGQCLVHPHLKIETIEEENYFFRFSKYQQPLLNYFEKHPDFVVPDFRFNEIKEFVKRGLKDFSISRLKEKMHRGVPVPADEAQVMYVWFDALINYVSTLGWPRTSRSASVRGKPSEFEDFWGTVENPKALQIAGKDNLRQQSAMWQAMLMSAGLPNSRQIIIHGFITSGGQKMSKSLGNVADPYEILDKLKAKGLDESQATDALRYYLLREIPTFEDGDYTWEHFVATYNANLANGIGNLTSRILKMAFNVDLVAESMKYEFVVDGAYTKAMEEYCLKEVADFVWNKMSALDAYIQKNEPFKVAKINLEKAKEQITYLLNELFQISHFIRPIIPRTADRISVYLQKGNFGQDPGEKLFPRIE